MDDTNALATGEALLKEIEQRTAALKPVLARRDALNERIVAERRAIEALQEQYDAHRITASADSPDWSFLLQADSGAAHSTRARLLEQAGFYGASRWAETDQACVKFMLRKGRPGEVGHAVEFVRLLLPHILAHGDGMKRFGVFERSLSEHGSYHVAIDEAAKCWQVVRTRYSSTCVIYDAPGLVELVQYLHDKLYYKIHGQDEDA